MTATRSNHFTTGRIYENVIRKERRGDYLGGTVGDIESLWCDLSKLLRPVDITMQGGQICGLGQRL